MSAPTVYGIRRPRSMWYPPYPAVLLSDQLHVLTERHRWFTGVDRVLPADRVPARQVVGKPGYLVAHLDFDADLEDGDETRVAEVSSTLRLPLAAGSAALPPRTVLGRTSWSVAGAPVPVTVSLMTDRPDVQWADAMARYEAELAQREARAEENRAAEARAVGSFERLRTFLRGHGMAGDVDAVGRNGSNELWLAPHVVHALLDAAEHEGAR